MEHLPVEVIGSILSQLGGARDVVIASATCKKWREACRKHLHMLSFNSNDFQRFPCLKSLSLSFISISALDLSLLLTACPKIELLELVNPEIAIFDAQVTVELSSPTLKRIYVEAIRLDKFILEADNIECLHLKDCVLELFELLGKGTLKHFKIDDVSLIHFDIGETIDNLEIVDVRNFTILWPKFYQMISKSSKLRKLRLWDVVFYDEDEILDLETIAGCFPQLVHFSFGYDLRYDFSYPVLQGSSNLENVVVLELGWTLINDLFSPWMEGLLKRCPNLKKLVIHGIVSEVENHEECQMLANLIHGSAHEKIHACRRSL